MPARHFPLLPVMPAKRLATRRSVTTAFCVAVRFSLCHLPFPTVVTANAARVPGTRSAAYKADALQHLPGQAAFSPVYRMFAGTDTPVILFLSVHITSTQNTHNTTACPHLGKTTRSTRRTRRAGDLLVPGRCRSSTRCDNTQSGHGGTRTARRGRRHLAAT